MALQEIKVPDIGNFKEVAIIDVLVKTGDMVKVDQSLITLESDKATMEIPSTHTGMVKELCVKTGDKVSEGSLILMMDITGETARLPTSSAVEPTSSPVSLSSSASLESSTSSDNVIMADDPRRPQLPTPTTTIDEITFAKAHASPSVRRFARELGVDLGKLKGSGRKGRILQEDVQAFVKQAITEGVSVVSKAISSNTGMGIPDIPVIDFSQFGEIETRPLSRIKKLSGASLHRSWLNIPHVTQFDEVDITELDSFREDLIEEGKKRNVKVTLLAFLLKAACSALVRFPDFNASLDPSRENLILKKYYHIGVAVDTTEGLVVPVIRDVNHKGLFELADELGKISQKARDKKLSPKEMQGACFTISSLGGIGGTGFTPIINAPEVAILGVSKSSLKPVYQYGKLEPRLMLPLCLSYDHRVIDGAAAARFTQYLGFILADVRRLLL